jgi:D-3-phosphoglycerate dehydrogenase
MELMEQRGIEVVTNTHGRKITTKELAQDIGDADVLIAGTEKITEDVFKNAPNLKFISRVGIGLDGIDFELCRKYGVRVAYTPDAPTTAVAELCVGLMIDLARKITFTSTNLKSDDIWNRHMGMLLYGKKIGIFGMGRIGKTLVHLLSTFNVEFLVNDIEPDIAFGKLYRVDFVEKEYLLQNSDIVSINIPLKEDTIDFIGASELSKMQKHALLVNTARGGIVNEDALYGALKDGTISGAAVDVFEDEPYCGDLRELDNVVLTCHMGASTIESRTDMEVEAVKEVLRFFDGEPLKNEVFENA